MKTDNGKPRKRVVISKEEELKIRKQAMINAKKLMSNYHSLELWDIFNYGMLTYYKNKQNFDSEKGALPSTYFYWVVKGAMIKYVRKNGYIIPVPLNWDIEDQRVVNFAEENEFSTEDLEIDLSLTTTILQHISQEEYDFVINYLETKNEEKKENKDYKRYNRIRTKLVNRISEEDKEFWLNE